MKIGRMLVNDDSFKQNEQFKNDVDVSFDISKAAEERRL